MISHALWIPHAAWILLIYYEQKLQSKEVLHSCIYHFPVLYLKIFTSPHYTHLQRQGPK